MALNKFVSLNADTDPLPDYLLDLDEDQLEFLRTSLEDLFPLFVNAVNLDDLETVIYNTLEIEELQKELVQSFEEATDIQEATELVVSAVNRILESISAYLGDLEDERGNNSDSSAEHNYGLILEILTRAEPGVRIQIKQPDGATRTFVKTKNKTWVEED